jgi:hypothetical protein
MKPEQIERRLRRLDAALTRSEHRLGTLVDVRDHHERRLSVALANAEAARESFVLSAQVAFRDPYRALKSWERHEWRCSNLTLGDPSDADVVKQTHEAVSRSTGIGRLTLRGRTRLGVDDAERTAAHAALAKLADERMAWLENVRLARTYGQAMNQVGTQMRGLSDRLRSGALRREELVEELREAHQRQHDTRDAADKERVRARALWADERRITERAELHRAYGDIVDGQRVPSPVLTEARPEGGIGSDPDDRAKKERLRLDRLHARARSREDRDLSR